MTSAAIPPLFGPERCTRTFARRPKEKSANASSHTGIKSLGRNARPEYALACERSWETLVREVDGNGAAVMDRFVLEHNLRDACARVVACQQALLSQRLQVRELERSGLDASVARALLEIYEESKAMALFNRACVAKAMALAQCTTGTTGA